MPQRSVNGQKNRTGLVLGLRILAGLALVVVFFIALPKPDGSAAASKPEATNPVSADSARIETPPEVESRPPAGTEVLRGRILDHQGRPIADQPYWTEWNRQDVDGPNHIGATHPPPHAPRTDSYGGFSITLEATVGVLWFRAPGGIRGACEINPSTLRQRAWNDIRLPPNATVTLRGTGVTGRQRFRVWVHPVTNIATGWKRTELEEWPTRFWHRNASQIDHVFTHAFVSREMIGTNGQVQLLAWRDYELEVRGVDFEVEVVRRSRRVVKAPGQMLFRAGSPSRHTLVVVRDPGRGPTTVCGTVITGALEANGPWRSRAALESGRWPLGCRMLRADEPTRLWVLMTDGELFRRRISVQDCDRHPVITFVRGKGTPPTRIALPPAAKIAGARILIAIDGKGLIRGRTIHEFDMPDDRDSTFAYGLTEDAIWLVRPPVNFSRVYVMTRDGRVASGSERASWSPGKDIPPVDLAQAFRDHGKNRTARAEFSIELVCRDGHRSWVLLDSLVMGPTTTWFPVWRKYRPDGMRARITLTVGEAAPIDLTRGR